MSKLEPYCALGFATLWGIYGAIYFTLRNKKTGKPVLVSQPVRPVAAGV